MSSPRSMLPTSVLQKLQSNCSSSSTGKVHLPKSPSPTCRRAISMPKKDKAIRKRCYSETRSASVNIKCNHVAAELGHEAENMMLLQPPSPPFTAVAAITQSTEQLGRISEDLRSVNADLSLRVVDLRRRLSCCAGSSSEEIDAGGDNVVHVVVNRDGTSSSCSSGFGDIASNAGDEMDDGMIDVCMAAADQDLRMADLARREFTAILTEIESAWHSEGRRMASRATRLNEDSADHFEKMSPVALQRLRSDGDKDDVDADAVDKLAAETLSMSV